MKIVFIIPSITNFHTFLSELNDSLIEEGHEVFLLAGEKPIIQGASPYDNSIKCKWYKVDFPRSLHAKKHLVAANKIDRIIQKIQADLIHVHFSAAMFTVSLAKKSNWPPVIATIHGLAWPSRKLRTKYLLKRAELSAAKKMDKVIVLNKADLSLLHENGVGHAGLLFNYGIGCNLEKFDLYNIHDQAIASLRDLLNIKPEDRVFIFIGRQTNFKGFDKVIRAFMSIYHSRSNYHLLLIGDKDYIHESGLSKIEESLLRQIPSIHQIGWMENIQNYLALADINVFPSNREGLPVNLMESLAMGVPVITINSRGCNEIIEDQFNGIIIEDDSVESLADAMKQLSENNVLLSSLSQNGLARRELYDRKKYIQQQVEFYEEFFSDEQKK